MYVDSPEKPHVILSLCSGMCGLERGIVRAIGKIRVAAYVEVESFIIENLLSLMEQSVLDAAPVWADLKTFPSKNFHGKIHGIIGGYPCQPFSLAGKLKGENDPRHLWPFIREHIKTVKPLWCFFENVANHLNVGYETVRGELQEMGYKVEEGIYSAQEAGATHRRERLFILAIMADTDGQLGGLSKREQRQKRNFQEQSLNVERRGQTMAYANRELWGIEQSICSGNGTWTRNKSFGHGETLADRIGARLQGHSGNEHREGWARFWSNRSTAEGGISLWPAAPGFIQHDWEEPRTVTARAFKSCLGGSAHGYNFREDLLRMYGNGVVEQSAEIAFLDLLKKHGITKQEKQNR